jgi:hypothetical protein
MASSAGTRSRIVAIALLATLVLLPAGALRAEVA